MKKIIAFGASNSPVSINKKLAVFAAKQLQDVEIQILDLNDFELPIFSVVTEESEGVPKAAQTFATHIKNCDGIVVSLAENNGLYTSAFKNLWDWMSRLETQKIWQGKPIFLMATSPSKRPELNVLKVSQYLFPLFGARIISSFSLPSFNHFFQNEAIIEPDLKSEFLKQLKNYQQFINNI